LARGEFIEDPEAPRAPRPWAGGVKKKKGPGLNYNQRLTITLTHQDKTTITLTTIV